MLIRRNDYGKSGLMYSFCKHQICYKLQNSTNSHNGNRQYVTHDIAFLLKYCLFITELICVCFYFTSFVPWSCLVLYLLSFFKSSLLSALYDMVILLIWSFSTNLTIIMPKLCSYKFWFGLYRLTTFLTMKRSIT